MKKNKVSIIVPIYNSEKYLKRCVESILNQTYDNIGVILINDGSKDNSLNIINDYYKNHPDKIKMFDQKNIGVAKTRNKGIKLSTGDYIMFVDNDDYLDNDYVETYLYNAMKGDYDIIIGGYRRPDENGNINKELKLKDVEWSKYMVMAPWAHIYKKELLVKNNILFLDNNIGEDVYFNLQAIAMTDKIKIINYIGYNWFYNKNSVSNTIQRKMNEINVLKLLNACFKRLSESNLIEKDYLNIEYYFIRHIIWYLLFSSKGNDKKVIYMECEEKFNWLKDHFPNYKRNKNVSFFRPNGEVFFNRLIVKVFLLLHRYHLDKVFLSKYSKM